MQLQTIIHDVASTRARGTRPHAENDLYLCLNQPQFGSTSCATYGRAKDAPCPRYDGLLVVLPTRARRLTPSFRPCILIAYRLGLSMSGVEPIAIVGIGCRLPGGVRSPDDLWTLLVGGVDAVVEVPNERWDLSAMYHPDSSRPGRTNTRWGGFLDQIDRFDAQF